MKRYIFITLFLLSAVFISGQEYERNIMIEVFTNSHCPLCPGAHNVINSYLANNTNVSRVRFMYYHMSFPYPDDQLYQENTSDANGRNQFYGPYSSTPKAFFDGEIQSNSYNQWSSRIDNRLAVMSPVKLELSGSTDGANVVLTADVQMSSNLTGSLVINFVVVEDVVYNGRNGITNHKNVVRDMVTTPNGEPITISASQKFTKTFTLSNDLNTSNVSFLVFVQNATTLEVHQAEEISYSALGTTDITEEQINYEFKLEQNYPNPFNPTTTIAFTIPAFFHPSPYQGEGPRERLVSLTVYNLLGQEIATLVKGNLNPGSHKVKFDAANLPSGIYFYTLSAGGFTLTKKLTLVK